MTRPWSHDQTTAEHLWSRDFSLFPPTPLAVPKQQSRSGKLGTCDLWNFREKRAENLWKWLGKSHVPGTCSFSTPFAIHPKNFDSHRTPKRFPTTKVFISSLRLQPPMATDGNVDGSVYLVTKHTHTHTPVPVPQCTLLCPWDYSLGR